VFRIELAASDPEARFALVGRKKKLRERPDRAELQYRGHESVAFTAAPRPANFAVRTSRLAAHVQRTVRLAGSSRTRQRRTHSFCPLHVEAG
jgi:hypothetical protein